MDPSVLQPLPRHDIRHCLSHLRSTRWYAVGEAGLCHQDSAPSTPKYGRKTGLSCQRRYFDTGRLYFLLLDVRRLDGDLFRAGDLLRLLLLFFLPPPPLFLLGFLFVDGAFRLGEKEGIVFSFFICVLKREPNIPVLLLVQAPLHVA